MNKLPKKPKTDKSPRPVVKDDGSDVSDEIIQKLNTQNEELITDLQRLRADFENYRKRVEQDKQVTRDFARQQTIGKLLPVIDNITRATDHLPDDLQANDWAQGVMKLPKLLDKELQVLGVEKIVATPDTIFNPEIHEAVQMDEDAEGENEVISVELQTGYSLDGAVLRPAMVKVTRK